MNLVTAGSLETVLGIRPAEIQLLGVVATFLAVAVALSVPFIMDRRRRNHAETRNQIIRANVLQSINIELAGLIPFARYSVQQVRAHLNSSGFDPHEVKIPDPPLISEPSLWAHVLNPAEVVMLSNIRANLFQYGLMLDELSRKTAPHARQRLVESVIRPCELAVSTCEDLAAHIEQLYSSQAESDQ